MSREAERHNKMQTREANCLVQKVLLFRLATTTVPVGNNSVVVNRWLFTETLVGTLFYTVEATTDFFLRDRRFNRCFEQALLLLLVVLL